MKKKFNPIACSFLIEKQTNGYIQLFPYGRFYPVDNRQEGQGGWYVDDSNGFELANQINSIAIDLMIDYEHQTLYIEENGKPNPAAGWIKKVEYISGDGLFAEVEWTDIARQQIKSKEYRYISPLFIADETGKVVKIINAALTNRPALHNLAEAYAASQSFFNQEENKMLELLKNLFGTPNATEDEIKQKLTALSASKGTNQVALSDVYTKLNEQQSQVVALTAKVNAEPDPSKYVALSELTKVQSELNTLKAKQAKDGVDALVTQALSDGRLLPSQKEWAEKLGASNVTALSEYLETVTPNPAFKGEKQAANNPNGKAIALSDEEKVAAKALGMTEAEFIKEHKETK